MKKGICYIVGAGENFGLDFVPQPGDFVIAADGGFKYLEQRGIPADLVIGDFDTLHYKPHHPNIIVLNRIKDDTDTLAAVREGIGLGYSVFHIYAGLGGDIGHSIANTQLLSYLAEQNKIGFLFGENWVLTAITNNSLTFPANAVGRISVFSASNISTGVCLKGLKYELQKATLRATFPIGVSNQFLGKKSQISVADGTLLIVFPNTVTPGISKDICPTQ